MDREVERRAKQIDTEVAQLKKDQSKEKYRLKQETDALRSEHQKKVEQLAKEIEDLERKRLGAESAVNALRKQMNENVGSLVAKLSDDLPMFAALSTGLSHSVSIANDSADGHHAAPVALASTWGQITIPPPSKELEALGDEAAFVDQLAWILAGESLYFTRDFLANLYITLKSASLNLIMGPPGYGKSSVVAGLARAMGHGNALLEIAVRRTWSDDRYLLGFYDTFHSRYDPGPTGLATRLLQVGYTRTSVSGERSITTKLPSA
ncbi:MAG: hypothetical protein K8T89_03655 [Planctomycetes bacterium]|nr:hypothetical protein [Planctomycetota bacterium]